MQKVPIISTNRILNRKILEHFRNDGEFFKAVFLDSIPRSIEHLMFELPEISIINFSDTGIDPLPILSEIRKDPWYHYGGIIAIHKDNERELLDLMRGSNIIALIRGMEFEAIFPRLIRILKQNRQIIFQRDLHRFLLKKISGTFVMDSDPFDIKTYSNLITNYLYNSNYIGRDLKDSLHIALMEMLMNAIEHGSCRISYDEKSDWLGKQRDIIHLIREKLRDPGIAARKVHFSYTITPDRSYFAIEDEGDGFDWRSRMQDSSGKVNLHTHGHGIRMTKHYVENLRYNDKGNRVSFEIRHQQNESNIIPRIFSEQQELVFEDGETVFREGEESNHLYYIVSGKLAILSHGRKLSTLSPNDTFLGEMSFLLNNRRSATVVSEGRSTLIKITKNEFMNAVKEHPHYGIFLARLLAQRISRLNSQIVQIPKDAAAVI